ncbi:MAG: hypothetical protein CR997_10275 [Acidobacteria bacterium]|nr:MAG: hypothetical protein CR997_10275 [Acidobacteriota bacterium]
MTNIKKSKTNLGVCPKCNKGLIVDNPKAYSCNGWKSGCDFVVWKVISSKTISKQHVRMLLRQGCTELIRGFKSRNGRSFNACLKLDKQLKIVFHFPEREQAPSTPAVILGDCPLCDQGRVLENKRGFGCDRWKQGCPFVIWKKVAQKEITVEIAEELLINGQTGELNGFINKKGETFSTCLMFDRNYKVVFSRSQETS